METLGARLKKLRERKGWTQKEAAKRFGITNYQLSRYESDISNPDPDLISKFSTEYEVSADYLLGLTERTSPSQGDETEFENWMNDPKVNKFYKEFKESPDERREALLAAWEYLKSLDKK